MLRSGRINLRRIVWVFACTSLAMGLVALATGVTLGLFYVGFAMCALVAPWAAASEETWDRQALMAASVTDGVALIWLVAILREGPVGIWGLLGAYGVCLAIAWVQVGFVRLLRPWGAATSAGLCILLTLGWLTTPAWLFGHLSQGAMQATINTHPLFAINSSVPLSIWTEAPLAYRVLDLNQDVFYTLPAGAWWCIVVHLAIGGGLIWIKAMAGRFWDMK